MTCSEGDPLAVVSLPVPSVLPLCKKSGWIPVNQPISPSRRLDSALISKYCMPTCLTYKQQRPTCYTSWWSHEPVIPVIPKFKLPRAVPQEAPIDPGWNSSLDVGGDGFRGFLYSSHQRRQALQPISLRTSLPVGYLEAKGSVNAGYWTAAIQLKYMEIVWR